MRRRRRGWACCSRCVGWVAPEVATFLNAAEPQLVLEAARAINDTPINDAMPALAKLLSKEDAVKLPEPVLFRVLNANFRLGKEDNAKALAAFASNVNGPELMRVEAIKELGMFAEPNGKDRVLGVWRPVEKRDPALATNAVRPLLPEILLGTPASPDSVKIAALDLLKTIGSEDKELLFKLVGDEKISPPVGAAALNAMNAQNDPRTDEAVEVALAHGQGALREQAIKFLARRPDAAERLDGLLKNGSIADQQAVFSALGTLEGNKPAEQIVSTSMDNLLAGKVAPELTLDLLDAAGCQQVATTFSRSSSSTTTPVPRMIRSPSSARRSSVGTRRLVKKIFFEKPEVSCIRCHKINGEGGHRGAGPVGCRYRGTIETTSCSRSSTRIRTSPPVSKTSPSA